MLNATQPQRASKRVVVLLKPADKKRLEQVAKAQQVSSAEILRRSFDAYDPQEEEVLKTGIMEMNRLLDGMLETLRATREQVQQNLASVQSQRVKA